MELLLAIFLWTTAVVQPWVAAFIGIFIAGSWVSELILAKNVVGLKTPASS